MLGIHWIEINGNQWCVWLNLEIRLAIRLPPPLGPSPFSELRLVGFFHWLISRVYVVARLIILMEFLQNYNATIEFYWAPFLVESNSDHPSMHSIPNRILIPDSIHKHAQHWKGVDFLVFNSYIWWLNTPAIKIQWYVINYLLSTYSSSR